MGKLKPVFVGVIHVGCEDLPATIAIDSASEYAFTEYCKKYKQHEKVKLVVTRLTNTKLRSVEQNNYYWGCVIKILAEELGYIGSMEKETLHEELKAMFLVKVGKLGNEYVEKTSVLDTATFERYLAAIRAWALDFQGIIIPKPNEVEISDTYKRI